MDKGGLMKDYLLKNIPDEEHRFLKTRAKMLGLSIKEFLIMSAYYFIENGGKDERME